jgi:CheY-specific phosphatase CheX
MEHKQILPQVLSEAIVQGVGSVYAPPVPVDKDDGLYGIHGVFSTIYLKGDLTGKISLFIRETCAAKVVSNMLGLEELSEGSSEIIDGMGEVLNIVAGCFKSKLDPHQVKFDISIPSIRMTSVIPLSTWEHHLEQVFTANDVCFKVMLSYRWQQAQVAPVAVAAPKPKLSAADLLKMAMAKKKA